MGTQRQSPHVDGRSVKVFLHSRSGVCIENKKKKDRHDLPDDR